jgi:hypothetical protein
MIWIAVIVLITGLMAWTLFGPVIIYLKTETNRYQLMLPGIFKAVIVQTDELFHIRGWIFFIPYRFDPFTGSKWRKKRKAGHPDERKWPELRSGNIQMMIDAFRSFRIRKLHLDLDTEDFVLNAWLVPAFTLINTDQIQLKVNFEGTSSLVLDLRTRLGSLLWIFIKNKYKSVFNL